MGGGCLGGGRPRGAARLGTRPRLLWPCLTCCGCFAATHPTCTSSWPGRGMCSCQAVSTTNHFPPPPYPLPSGFCDDTNAGCYCPSNTTYGRIPAAVDAPLGEALALIVAAWMKARRVRAALSQPCRSPANPLRAQTTLSPACIRHEPAGVGSPHLCRCPARAARPPHVRPLPGKLGTAAHATLASPLLHASSLQPRGAAQRGGLWPAQQARR